MGNGILIGSTVASERKENGVLVSGIPNQQEKAVTKEGKRQGNSIYVGDLVQSQDRVSTKFAQAQKSAIQKIMDQFEADLKIDEEMEERSNRMDELRESVCDTYQQIKGIDEQRKEIAERYENEPDSQKKKELELLECDQLEEKYRDSISDNKKNIAIEGATIQATQKALLKVHPMVDAQKEADKIMKSAIREQISDFLQEGVDKLDEDAKERQEELAEAQEEALEKKIQREKLKKEEADSEEAAQELQETVFSVTMQTMSNGQQAIENLQENVKSLIQDQIVLDVDMKGLRVDKQV